MMGCKTAKVDCIVGLSFIIKAWSIVLWSTLFLPVDLHWLGLM